MNDSQDEAEGSAGNLPLFAPVSDDWWQTIFPRYGLVIYLPERGRQQITAIGVRLTSFFFSRSCG